MDTASAPHSTAATPKRRPRRWPLLILALALALALAAALWHIVALEAYIAAGRPYDPTASRLASAELAAGLEPWDVRFGWRATALRGLDLLQKGDVEGAYALVDPNIVAVHGTDATYVSVYQQIMAIKTPIDSGKAHVAHGLDPLNNFTVRRPSVPSTTATP